MREINSPDKLHPSPKAGDKSGAMADADSKKLAFAEAFSNFRVVEKFAELASIGGPKSIELMQEMLRKHPSAFSFEPEDPNHLLNRKNVRGCTALYLACLNGNMTTVRFLLEMRANAHIPCRV
jgi:ankyrin repeat protein